jgi:S1-C subfamily serine protease
MKRALTLLALLGAVAGCGGGGNKGSQTTTGTTPTGSQTTQTGAVKPPDDGAARPSFDAETIYKTRSPGVVTVISLIGDGSNLTGTAAKALGSGFVVDAAGYVATNAHVVTTGSGANAQSVYVQFGDGNQLAARIVGTDLDSDVALLKVDPSKLRGPNAKIVPVPLGTTSELQVGDPVAAIGSPFGEPQSLSVGVVSALNRDIESLTNFTIGNAVQTDAAINHGNSGGPLLNAGGKVVGINSQIQSTSGGGEGVGFAIPIETAKRSIEQLRANGKVTYAYLGVKTVHLYPQLAERLGLNVLDGALIDSVQKGGPADKAGLRGAKSHITFQGQPGIPVGGDVIVAVEGRPLIRPDDLSDIVGTHRPGDTLNLEIVRSSKKRLTVPVKLAARPSQPAGA